MGRPPIHGSPMDAAERQRRRRAKLRNTVTAEPELRDEDKLRNIVTAKPEFCDGDEWVEPGRGPRMSIEEFERQRRELVEIYGEMDGSPDITKVNRAIIALRYMLQQNGWTTFRLAAVLGAAGWTVRLPEGGNYRDLE
jgi:hypothetical protein